MPSTTRINHHDTGYKELFSHPEFVQQLLEGFTPPEISGLMDFRTLKNHSGNYITPLFEEKFEDVVWSVEVTWDGATQRVFLYLLLEFQSTVDHAMPIRLMHYVACFYDHLLKTKQAHPGQGLPPIFPVVLYNGAKPWRAKQDIYDMIAPEPPEFLRAYQPHIRYYLVDEARYTDEQLGLVESPLSGVFGIEKASKKHEGFQKAVDRIVAIIQADPHKHRIDKIVTRWLKRHLQRLGADVDLDRLNSLLEEKDMLAENLESWAKQEQQRGRHEGVEAMLRKQINLKFGELPEWADQRLKNATDEQLDEWVMQILSADSLTALLGEQ
ncbi:Rpn family recombination-promoting nuclease/putative transposase [Marinobacter persicus]|uniref:YhgA-like transposase n=1 Tax=Marinobacter persicus TaxID=930118 RepID=A0A2S6G415_9GAMM|nr:Rpn family recombination-promoting nuclease/putative transposase [Marinobacter persicus]PPK51799.1 putative YhgA-like transposase [Marinobacter persicus]PPK53822.1 putative YhgA-like transposase [Marinobacter persicus]PPK58730.1 putative YhgA-like transposase [Marinobacter persicus]